MVFLAHGCMSSVMETIKTNHVIRHAAFCWYSSSRVVLSIIQSSKLRNWSKGIVPVCRGITTRRSRLLVLAQLLHHGLKHDIVSTGVGRALHNGLIRYSTESSIVGSSGNKLYMRIQIASSFSSCLARAISTARSIVRWSINLNFSVITCSDNIVTLNGNLHCSRMTSSYWRTCLRVSWFFIDTFLSCFNWRVNIRTQWPLRTCWTFKIPSNDSELKRFIHLQR